MVKTTINLDTDVYRELINESVEKYGTTKTLSKLINEKLRNKPPHKYKGSIVEKTKGTWRIKETGLEYTKRIRKEWEKRQQV